MTICILKTNYQALLALLLMVGLLSCQKEELVSKERIRDFKVDTLFFQNLDLLNFNIISTRKYDRPVITEDAIYFIALTPNFPDYELYKISRVTGEVVWRWGNYEPGDSRLGFYLSYDNGKLLFATSDHAYFLNTTSGNTEFTYSPPAGSTLGGALLHGGKFYVAHSDTLGAFVKEMNDDGSNEQVIHFTENTSLYLPRARGLDIHQDGATEYISFQLNLVNPQSNDLKLLVSELGPSYNFDRYSLYQDPYSFNRAAVVISNKLLYTSTYKGQLSCFGIDGGNGLRWSLGKAGDKLYVNSSNVYAYALDQFVIADKTSGDIAFSASDDLSLLTATDKYIFAAGDKGFQLMDAETGDFIHHLDQGVPTGVKSLGQDEFLIWGNLPQPSISILRITPEN